MKYEIVAQRIKEALNDMNMSAAELSRLSGVGKAAISHYTTGRYCPHNDNAVAIALVLKVNPTWLMGFPVSKYQTQKEVSLTIQETMIIEQYRRADKETRAMVEKILSFSDTMQEKLNEK